MACSARISAWVNVSGPRNEKEVAVIFSEYRVGTLAFGTIASGPPNLMCERCSSCSRLAWYTWCCDGSLTSIVLGGSTGTELIEPAAYCRGCRSCCW